MGKSYSAICANNRTNKSIRVEFISASESYISINTIFNWSKTQFERFENIRYPKLAALALGLAIFLMKDADPMTEYWLGEPDQIELSAEDRAILNELMEKMSHPEGVASANRKFYKTLARDGAMKSVGICENPARPLFLR